ncbi:hypothetical protein DEO72_LG5g485 [Vigna unguiculata]|uniref:Uncharacterized protein n=1 Tax=Vigna unguiculata TaxID=3917 RepID=A0A4D6LU05_VIGUN|nr:hypothetical protein DEO72_LG5g485 [Vigna unguiculata]
MLPPSCTILETASMTHRTTVSPAPRFLSDVLLSEMGVHDCFIFSARPASHSHHHVGTVLAGTMDCIVLFAPPSPSPRVPSYYLFPRTSLSCKSCTSDAPPSSSTPSPPSFLYTRVCEPA